MTTSNSRIEGEEERLPLHIPTVALSLWKKRRLVVSGLLISLFLGGACGFIFGARIYNAEAVLLYAPQEETHSPDSSGDFKFHPNVMTTKTKVTLATRADMIKMRSNLEEARRRLKLLVPLQRLEESVEASARSESTLLSIKTRWTSPKKAMQLANVLADVFLEKALEIKRQEITQTIEKLKLQLSEAEDEFKEANAKILGFMAEHGIVDIDKELGTFVEDNFSIELMYEKARIERRSLELQIASLDRIISDLKRRVAAEQATTSIQDMNELNIRIGRVQAAIDEERLNQYQLAKLAATEIELTRAEKLKALGGISEAHYNQVRETYLRQKELTFGTRRIKGWKRQLEKLDQMVLPSSAGAAPSFPILRDMMLRAFNIQLERVAWSEKVKRLRFLRRRLLAKGKTLSSLQREYIDLNQEVLNRDAARQAFKQALSSQKSLLEFATADFILVAEAKVPEKPITSNRTVVAFTVVLFCTTLGLSFVLALEIFNPTIRSAPELELKLSIPVFGVLPSLKGQESFFPHEGSEPKECFRSVARKIREVMPKRGARILFVSANRGVGKTLVVANLAACYGRQDERVLLLDGHLRAETRSVDEEVRLQAVEKRENSSSRIPFNYTQLRESLFRFIAPARGTFPRKRHEPRELISHESRSLMGIGEYLSFETDETGDIIWPTFLPGVECLPKVCDAIIPDLVGSNRMNELLEKLSQQYTLTLIDGPAVLPYVDAKVLARWADAILLVVQSESCTLSDLREAIRRLRSSPVTFLGGILNGVNTAYLNWQSSEIQLSKMNGLQSVC